MIGLDTNILARYYIEDKSDAEAAHQSVTAQRLIESGQDHCRFAASADNQEYRYRRQRCIDPSNFGK